MVNQSFFEKVNHYEEKLSLISRLRNLSELNVSLDRLNSEEKVEQELIYFNCDDDCKCDNKERKGLFIFSQEYFYKELNDQEFKKILGQNLLNLLILEAYNKLKRNDNVSINELIEDIIMNNSSLKFLSKSKILKRILTLAYYHNWDLQKAQNEIDSNYSISIPEDFVKIKQRFNLEITILVIDTDKYKLFVNAKGDLCLVMKKTEFFSKSDLIKALDLFKIQFGVKKINILE